MLWETKENDLALTEFSELAILNTTLQGFLGGIFSNIKFLSNHWMYFAENTACLSKKKSRWKVIEMLMRYM